MSHHREVSADTRPDPIETIMGLGPCNLETDVLLVDHRNVTGLIKSTHPRGLDNNSKEPCCLMSSEAWPNRDSQELIPVLHPQNMDAASEDD